MIEEDPYVCDHCGCEYSYEEMAETIEELLCDYCASGIDEAEEERLEHDYDYPEDDPE